MTQGQLYRGWKTIVVCASGPSFTPDQQALVVEARARGLCRVIVVNNQWEHVPNADVLYAADGKWWMVNLLPALKAGFAGELWTQDADAAKLYELRCIESVPGTGLHDGDVIAQGGNSGYQAIGLAAKFGATRIILAGFDMRRGPNGEKHNHPDHALPLSNGNPAAWVPRFAPLARDLAATGVQVINCSSATALACFPRATLESALSFSITEA